MIDKERKRYDFRNAYLKALGYANYKQYLSSDDWKKIRNEVLRNGEAVCVLCEKPAQVAHHLKYDPAVLLGLWNHYLAPLCHKCHEIIELEEGAKNSHHSANSKFFTALRSKRTATGKAWEKNHYKCLREARDNGTQEKNYKMVQVILNENWIALKEVWHSRAESKKK